VRLLAPQPPAAAPATEDLAGTEQDVSEADDRGPAFIEPEPATREEGARQRPPRPTLEETVVAVVGLRTVGLPTAVALRSAAATVIGIDSATSRLQQIRGGRTELSGAERERLRSHLGDDAFLLTDGIDKLAEAEFVIICVPTPVNGERRPNEEMLKRACTAVVAHARRGQTLVLSSTTHVGGTRELLVDPLERRGLRVGEDVFVAFAPTRVDPGVPEHDQLSTPLVLGAVTDRCYEQAAKVLEPICEQLHRVSSPEAAEMVKLYESTFRAVNIALAFEMADACRSHGLDAIEVTDAAATKPYGFLAHYPSAGAGGSSIGVVPHHLTEPLRDGGRPATITEEALRKLAARPRHVVWRAQELLVRSSGEVSNARVLVVGAAYKPGIADVRLAPAVEIIWRLQAEGLQVDYQDPLVPELRIGDDLMYAVDPDPRRDASGFGPEDYDLAILVTLHPDHDYGWLRRVPKVLDCTYRTLTGRQRYVP
jgi:nucleotide sugar dehydrogenase